MFEWIFETLKWVQTHTSDFFQPYLNIGLFFPVIIIVVTTVYAVLVIQPYKRYLMWKHPEYFINKSGDK